MSTVASDFAIDYVNKRVTHNITTTGASGTGTAATLTFAAQPEAMTSGAIITVSGVTPSGYNGTYTVTSATTTSVTYASTTTGAQTTAGFVAANGVYTVNALYTMLMDAFDEIAAMDDEVPMSAQTPTEYTMINGWFIDDESVKFLKTGAIKTIGYTGNIIQALTNQSGGWTNCIPGDIGKVVTNGGATHTGTLLAYNNTTRKVWVRQTLSVFTAEAWTITTGTGAGTATSVASGEDLYSNIYTLGTIADNPAPLVYVQQGESFEENVLTSWWARGHIDVLIKVKTGGVTLNDGNVRVFARQSGDLFDYFQIGLSSGGRNAVPLATSTDLNQVDPDYYMFYDGESAPFTTGLILTGSSGATAEIMGITDWGTSGLLKLRTVIGTFSNNDTITDSGSGSAVVNGTIGTGFITFDSEVTPFSTLGQVITGTSGKTGTLVAIQDDAGAVGKLLVSSPSGTFPTLDPITGATNGSATTTAASTTSVAGYLGIKVWFMNSNLNYDGGTVAFTLGETVTGTSGATGVVLQTGTTASGTLYLGNRNSIAFLDNDILTGSVTGAAVANGGGYPGSTITKAFDQATAKNYKVVIDAGLQPLAEVYEFLKFTCRQGSISQFFRTEDSILSMAYRDSTANVEYTVAANDVGSTSNDVVLMDSSPVSGIDGVGDAFYFGGAPSIGPNSIANKFGKVKVVISTAGVGTWGFVWEYWNGTAWASLVNVLDNTATVPGDSPAASFKVVGSKYVTYDVPSNWATTTINGNLSYYIRARLSSYTSTTTAPLASYLQLYPPQLPVTGAVYSDAHFGYTPVKASPFGTFAGGKFFGARGIWVQNMASSDIQNYQLTDADNNTQTPPNYQSVTVANLLANDRVSVFRTMGTGSNVVNKAMYSADGSVNTSGNGTFVVDGAISVDTPPAGFIRIRNAVTGAEERKEYTAWTASTFTLVGTLANSYTTNDTIYVPFIDDSIISGTSKSVSVIYANDRDVVIRVRRYAPTAILPFETTGVFGASGLSVSAIRTTDTIVTPA